VSARGERELPLADYYTGYRTSVRADDELVRCVRIPLPLASTTSFQKVAKRRYDDISSVAVAMALEIADGVVRSARIGLGGVTAVPIRARATEDALTGRPWDRPTVERAAQVLSREGSPIDDHRASAAYRAAMLGQALRRLLAQTTGREVPA
jgi:xanthine dehydrogenase small subunit